MVFLTKGTSTLLSFHTFPCKAAVTAVVKPRLPMLQTLPFGL